ncbi:MAG: type II toxin-antitoxin system RatA family toxin [Xanthomonadales bacterium]|nr:type II toxin-antitoxin system RatA family toxin [Xanthomonadales bacterium]
MHDREPVTIQRQAWVGQARERVFALVHDVEGYPARFAWCHEARVLASGDGEPWIVARLAVELAGVPVAFATRNRYRAPEWIAMSLVEGPFRSLEGEWRFTALGERATRIDFRLALVPGGRLLAAAARRGFSRLAERMVTDFCLAAERLGDAG